MTKFTCYLIFTYNYMIIIIISYNKCTTLMLDIHSRQKCRGKGSR
jgi:hypothetical protein